MAANDVMIVLGSPRFKGNSCTLAQQVRAGAEAAGATVGMHWLHGMVIRPCNACDACRAHADKDCVTDDDMASLYPALRQTPALVIASPIYWATVSAQTKLFLDRCYALGGPDPQENGFRGKRVGVVLTYGDPDPFCSGAVNALRMFQDGFRYLGATLVDMVYGSASKPGEVAGNEKLMQAAYRLGEKLLG